MNDGLEFKVKNGEYVNRFKMKMDGDICKIYINNGQAYGAIRLDQEKLKLVLAFVQCNIK